MDKKQVFILLSFMFLMIVAVFTILVMDASKNTKGKRVDVSKTLHRYKVFSSNVFTKNNFMKISRAVSDLSIYDTIDVKVKSVQFFITSTSLSALYVLFGILMFKDLIATSIIALYALVMQNVVVNKQLNKLRYKMILELSIALASLRETYTLKANIPDAFANCKKGKHLEKPFEQIHTMLTANESRDLLDDFLDTNPFSTLRTLAISAYILNDAGDCENDAGVPVFKQAVSTLRKDVEAMKRKLIKQKIIFNSLEYLPLASVFFIGPIQKFFMTYIPGTALVYKGMVGYTITLVCLLLSFIGYYTISTINDQNTIASDDRVEIIDNLLQYKKYRRLVESIVPKKARKKERLNVVLTGALSRKDVEYLYASKILISCSVFLFALLASFIITISAKEYTYNTIGSLSLNSTTELTYDEESRMHNLDESLMDLKSLPGDSELQAKVKSILISSTEFEELDQVDRIKTKYVKYNSIHFKAYYILISYALAMISWFIPEALLKLRKYLVRAEESSDVMQLQIIISILMYTSLDSLDLLYWLMKTSIIHKDVLSFAYNEYPSDAEMAIDRMKKQSQLPEFIQLCDKLKNSIYDVSIAEAFSDLMEERENMADISEMIQMSGVEKKRRLASPIAMAPVIITAIGQVVVPIGILGYQSFASSFAALS